MIKPNNQNSNQQFSASQNSPSNTPLDIRYTPPLSTHSFKSLLLSSLDSQNKNNILKITIDYLRISSSKLSKRSFENLLANLVLPVPCFENKILWHTHPKMPKSKKYQNSIESDKGIIGGYTKRAKYRGRNTRYAYDIMIDFSGSYFANLSLVEQIKLINYLNSYWKLKCHRIDVAIDDYSEELFPVRQMILAIERGDCCGFTKNDKEYFRLTNEGWSGTLGVASRRSELFIRIYSQHKDFIRWEAELKQNKAQRLFTELASLGKENDSGTLPTKDINKALVDAALDQIDFRDKSSSKSPINCATERTIQLPFWRNCKTTIYSLIEN